MGVPQVLPSPYIQVRNQKEATGISTSTVAAPMAGYRPHPNFNPGSKIPTLPITLIPTPNGLYRKPRYREVNQNCLLLHRKQTMVTKRGKGGKDKLRVWEKFVKTTVHEIDKQMLYGFIHTQKIDKQEGLTVAQGIILNILQ